MADVWLARDAELDDEVVLKIVPPDAPPERVELLRRECRHARRLVHPGIVRVYDFRRANDVAFLVMEHVPGDDLASLRGAGMERVVAVAAEIADALASAHQAGIVHRDLKPANVLLDRDGRPRIVDFGIAGILDPAPGSLEPVGGFTRPYAGPQQRSGEAAVPADDAYAFGALIFDLLTGSPPRARESEQVRLPESAVVPAGLRTLVDGLLSLSAEQRPGPMAAVRDELREIRAAEGSSASTTAPRLAPPPRPRVIAPLPPPRGVAGTAPRSVPSKGIPWWIWAGIVALVLLAVEVFVVLPRWAERKRTSSAATATVQSAIPETDSRPPAGPEAAVVESQERSEVDASLERVQELRRSLQARGAAEWAAAEWVEAEARVTEGDRRFTEGLYRAAAQSYDQAIEQLVEIERLESQTRQANLAEDRRRLAAEARDELLAELDTARSAELAGELDSALAAYERAARLGPEDPTARSGVERVRQSLKDDAFASVMSQALRHFEQGEFGKSRQSLARAGTMRPGSPAVADALARLDAAEQTLAVAGHRVRGEVAESEERWRDAEAEYLAALALDPAVRFAQDGSVRAAERAELSESMGYHLAHPDRLVSDPVLEEVEGLYEEAEEADPAGPRHLAQLADLAALLEKATVEIPVVLESDEQTEVTVYHVGRLGRFARRELNLRPGRYTVVGSRRGYRDVRRTLVVAVGGSVEPIRIRCEDEL